MTGQTTRQQLAELARELQGERSVEQTMQHVADAAVSLVSGCRSASVSLLSRTEPLTIGAVSDELARRGDLLQVELDQGPCVDAAWEDSLVNADDLDDEPRWPEWSARVVQELDVRSMLSVRLFTRRDRLGALNLYGTAAHAFDEDDIDVAQALAAHSSVAVADARKDDDFRSALTSRTTIGQATGLIMAEHNLSGDDAFHLLGRLSSHQNRKIVVIAQELVAKHEAGATTLRRGPAGSAGSAPTE